MRRLTKKLLIESLMRQFSKIDRNNRKKMVASRGQFQLAAWDSGDIVYVPWVDPQKKKISKKVLRTQKGGRIGSKWGQFDNFQESSKTQGVFATANLVNVFIICWPTKKKASRGHILKVTRSRPFCLEATQFGLFHWSLKTGVIDFVLLLPNFFIPLTPQVFLNAKSPNHCVFSRNLLRRASGLRGCIATCFFDAHLLACRRASVWTNVMNHSTKPMRNARQLQYETPKP